MRYDLTGLEYYVYNKDIKGSTTNIIDNNKNVKISYKYSDFGETEEFGDTDFYNEIAYTGGIYDESTSLYYLNARYYNPEDARFITQDTYRNGTPESSSLHLYTYCANNPINYIDPSVHVLVTISKVKSVNFIIGASWSKGIVISSSGRIGVFKGMTKNIKIGSGSVGVSIGVAAAVYGNTSRLRDLKYSSFYAHATVAVSGANVTTGTTMILKNGSKKGKVIPYIGMGAGFSTSGGSGFDTEVGLGSTQIKALDYNIAWYIKHRNDNKRHTFEEYIFNEKVTVKSTKYNITLSYGGISMQFANYKRYTKK